MKLWKVYDRDHVLSCLPISLLSPGWDLVSILAHRAPGGTAQVGPCPASPSLSQGPPAHRMDWPQHPSTLQCPLPQQTLPQKTGILSVFSLPDRLSNQALYALSLFPNYRQPWTHYTQRPHSWSGMAKPTPLSSPLGASSRLPNPLAPLTRRNHVSLPLFERKHEARPSSVPHTLTLLSKQTLQLR